MNVDMNTISLVIGINETWITIVGRVRKAGDIDKQYR